MNGHDNPPKTILAPPPPPAPPPPATRNLKASPGALGISNQRSPLAPSRAPPTMGAPVVPQHRNQVLNKMLRGLEDDSLTVADVLGVLETELRSGAPSQAPLSEQFERYIGPLAEISGPSYDSSGFAPREPEPLHSGIPLLGPAPNAMVPPPIGGSNSQRRVAGGAQAETNPQHIIVNCARCAVLEQQVKALSQSLSGLGARMFNWSLAHCKEHGERIGLWHLIIKYLQPVMTVDHKISETCSGLQSAVGTSGGAAHVAAENFPNRNFNFSSNRNLGAASRSVSPAPVWQPPGVSKSAVGSQFGSPRGGNSPGSKMRQQARFADDPLHKAAPASMTYPDSEDSSRAQTPSSGLPPSAIEMRAEAQLPKSAPASPEKEGFVSMAEGVTVRFGINKLAKQLNGFYEMVPGKRVNARPVYTLGKRSIVHLRDGTWVIKDGPEDDVDANVYAYAKDIAREPPRIRQSWYVIAEKDGWVLDPRGFITRGHSDKGEAIEAASYEAARLANEGIGGGRAGMKAEAGLMDRADREELQQFRAAAYRGLDVRKMEQSDEKKEQSDLEKVEELLKEEEEEAEEMNSEDEVEKRKTEKVDLKTPTIPKRKIAGPGKNPRIKITIVRAMNLRRADLFGSSDPYVVVSTQKRGELGRTGTVNNTTNPDWNEEITVDYKEGERLKFTVYDQDVASRSDELGEAELKPERFFPDGFRGSLALKYQFKTTRSTLDIKIDVLKDDEASAKGVIPLLLPLGHIGSKLDKKKRDEVDKEHNKEIKDLMRKLKASEIREMALKEKLKMESDKLAIERLRVGKAEAQIAGEEVYVDDYDIEDYDYDEEDEDQDEDLEHLRKAFNRFDTDGSGVITLWELKKVMTDIGKPMLEGELRKVLQKADQDFDGVEIDEFIDLVDTLNRLDTGSDDFKAAKYMAMFKACDVNNDGGIGVEELQEVMKITGKDFDWDEVEDMLDEEDAIRDGLVDFNEFMNLMKKLEDGLLKKRKDQIVDVSKYAPGTTLAGSERKRVVAWLTRKGFPGNPDLRVAVNQQKKKGGGLSSKKGYEYPLHTAAIENNQEIVYLLLTCGADRNQTDSAGLTPYKAAVQAEAGRGSHKKVKDMLVPLDEETNAAGQNE